MNSMVKQSPVHSAPATLANWRAAPHNQWAFHHVREILPSADIANDALRITPLPSQPSTLPEAEKFFARSASDGLLILHRGRVRFERYANGMTDETPHILMSVSKSMLGLLAGVLSARGALDLEAKVAGIVPEIADGAYA